MAPLYGGSVLLLTTLCQGALMRRVIVGNKVVLLIEDMYPVLSYAYIMPDKSGEYALEASSLFNGDHLMWRFYSDRLDMP